MVYPNHNYICTLRECMRITFRSFSRQYSSIFKYFTWITFHVTTYSAKGVFVWKSLK